VDICHVTGKLESLSSPCYDRDGDEWVRSDCIWAGQVGKIVAQLDKCPGSQAVEEPHGHPEVLDERRQVASRGHQNEAAQSALRGPERKEAEGTGAHCISGNVGDIFNSSQGIILEGSDMRHCFRVSTTGHLGWKDNPAYSQIENAKKRTKPSAMSLSAVTRF
jgi:hypothetical protein